MRKRESVVSLADAGYICGHIGKVRGGQMGNLSLPLDTSLDGNHLFALRHFRISATLRPLSASGSRVRASFYAHAANVDRSRNGIDPPRGSGCRTLTDEAIMRWGRLLAFGSSSAREDEGQKTNFLCPSQRARQARSIQTSSSVPMRRSPAMPTRIHPPY